VPVADAAAARERIRARLDQGKSLDENDLYIVQQSAKIAGSSTSDPGKSRALLQEIDNRK